MWRKKITFNWQSIVIKIYIHTKQKGKGCYVCFSTSIKKITLFTLWVGEIELVMMNENILVDSFNEI